MIDILATLGKEIQNYLQTPAWNDLQASIQANNAWFTPPNTQLAIEQFAQNLTTENLKHWLKNYDLILPKQSLKVGVLAAGNIPMVCWHDILCVLLSGHTLHLKMSSDDRILPLFILDLLQKIEPSVANRIVIVDMLKGIDAIIATGNNNSARYFHYYFSKIPAIIRQNRNSCAILTGQETPEDLEHLGNDIFQYFGLGCRSITKLYVPENYDFTPFFEALKSWEIPIVSHHKYNNNYDYHKALFLLNKVEHLDNGYLLVAENQSLSSPIGVLYYEKYAEINTLLNDLKQQQDKIQCIATKLTQVSDGVPLGTTQMPSLWHYADKVDTMQFLLNL